MTCPERQQRYVPLVRPLAQDSIAYIDHFFPPTSSGQGVCLRTEFFESWSSCNGGGPFRLFFSLRSAPLRRACHTCGRFFRLVLLTLRQRHQPLTEGRTVGQGIASPRPFESSGDTITPVLGERVHKDSVAWAFLLYFLRSEIALSPRRLNHRCVTPAKHLCQQNCSGKPVCLGTPQPSLSRAMGVTCRTAGQRLGLNHTRSIEPF